MTKRDNSDKPAPFIRPTNLADAGLLMVYGLARLLPVSWVSAFGAWRGRYRGKKRAELEARARQNLAEIAPDADPDLVLPRLRAASGRALLEVLIADRLARGGRVTFEPHDQLQQALTSQRSIVFALIHHANLGDVAGAGIVNALPQMIRRYIVTRDIQHPATRWMVQRTRHQSMQGMAGVVSGPVQGLARQMLEGLIKRAPSIALLHVDEARHHQVPFPSFGAALPTKAINAVYAVRLARRTNAYLAAVVLTREDACPTRFRLRVLSAWDMVEQSQSNPEICQNMSQLFEQEISKDPANWLNLYHRRPNLCQPTPK